MHESPEKMLHVSGEKTEIAATNVFDADKILIHSIPFSLLFRFLDKEFYPKTPENRNTPNTERKKERAKLLRFFDVPDFLPNDTCTDINGYFGCKPTYDESEVLESYSTHGHLFSHFDGLALQRGCVAN